MSGACPQYPVRRLAVFWGTAVCQGISPAWHWVSVGLLTGLLTSKRILQSAVKTSFPRRLGYHRSIKCFFAVLHLYQGEQGVFGDGARRAGGVRGVRGSAEPG